MHANELISIRPYIFISLLIIFSFLEYLYPLYKNTQTNKLNHALTNFLHIIFFIVILNIVFPTGAILLLESLVLGPNWGIQNINNELIKCLLTFILLEGVIYFQHRLFHHWDWLWRIHKVHHTDQHIVTTSAVRFHIVEYIISYVLKISFVVLIGGEVLGFIIFEVMLSSFSMLNHSNTKVFGRFQSVFITPEVHDVHHYAKSEYVNSNYGFFLNIWDRIFCTYVDPKEVHSDDKIFWSYNKVKELSFIDLLLLPFKGIKK